MNLAFVSSLFGGDAAGPGEDAVKALLESAAGKQLRNELGEWVGRVLPAEAVVPDVYAAWRPLVRDAMQFMVNHLSATRLAPKLIEQARLSPATPAPERLLRLIAKVPGLQKIGQILARNRHLERGVFKVLKPYVPAFFGEDLQLLQALADFLATAHPEYGHALPETILEVRSLLAHEIDFRREQRTVDLAGRIFRGTKGVSVPRCISALCTPNITALSAERGVKITELPAQARTHRRQAAKRLVEALVAGTLFSKRGGGLFHADPHAGNLLYDEETREIVLLDWALTERLGEGRTRQIVLLGLMLALRDPAGVAAAIEPMVVGARLDPAERRIVRDAAESSFANMPLTHLPGSMDAMRLLDRLALAGIRFPPGLMMFRKMLFTLDGVLHDLDAPDLLLDLVVARGLLTHSPLDLLDWMGVESSALLYGWRVCTAWAEAAVARW